MKRIISVLSFVAIVASALFVSCVNNREFEDVPAFPTKRDASYVQNDKGVWSWSFASGDKYTAANEWLGFEVYPDDPNKKFLLDYHFATNFDWTVNIVGAKAKEYLAIRVGKGGYDGYKEELFSYVSSTSGKRGDSKIVLMPLKTPAYGEEPVVCELTVTMAGQTMPLSTITIEAAVVPTPEQPEVSEPSEGEGEGEGDSTEGEE